MRRYLGAVIGAASVAAAWGASPAGAEPLPPPRGEVVLTVTGALAETNDGDAAAFDMAMLDALPQRTIVTATPWYDRRVAFSGPLLRDVLARVGARGKAVAAHAVNDFDVEIPAADADRGLVLATGRDGARMPLSDKGPIFAMYPFDDDPGLRSQVYFTRCVWELESLRVE